MDKNSLPYKKALKEANKIYGTKSNIYRSSYIVQKYKDYGGVYKEKRNPENEKLTQWFDEKWISVIPYLERNEIVICGSSDGNQGCRPLFRINKNTPITMNELLKIHSKQEILKMAYFKKRNPNIRVDWKTLTYK
jgi:hypothetical protein